IFEFAHLERGSHEDRNFVQRMAPALQRFDFIADRARFLFGVPGAGHSYLFTRLLVGSQCLAEPAFVEGDEMGCGGKDVSGGPIIALEPDHLRARKVVLEAKNVVDLGTAPAVDRLIVIADAADVSLNAQGSGRRCGRVGAARVESGWTR